MKTSKASVAERAYQYLRKAPRINDHYLRGNPGSKTKGRLVRAKDNKAGQTHKELQRAAKPPLGWIFGDFHQPWQRRFPSEPFYNKDIHLRRESVPLSLLELQRLIDLNWLDCSEPIDLAALCKTRRFYCQPELQQFGVHLTDIGSPVWKSGVELEVQWASEATIAAVERAGGTVISAYYDPASLDVLVNPIRFLESGQPIPRRRFPPADILPFYTDPKNRGYLAEPKKVEEARKELAQKYGYAYVPTQENLLVKDPLQIFYGLDPGSVVNLKDKVVLKPKSAYLQQYYNS